MKEMHKAMHLTVSVILGEVRLVGGSFPRILSCVIKSPYMKKPPDFYCKTFIRSVCVKKPNCSC